MQIFHHWKLELPLQEYELQQHLLHPHIQTLMALLLAFFHLLPSQLLYLIHLYHLI